MPEIIIRGSQCSLVGTTPEINSALEEEFSYNVQGHEYSDKFKEGDWNGKQYVLRDRHFSIGLLYDVISSLEKKNIEVTVKDFRKLGEGIALPDGSIPLRPYQKEIVDKAIEYKSSSIQVATGGGKTLIAADFMRLGLQTLMLVPSVEILRQTQENLSEYLNTEIGIIGDKEYDIKNITVATWQSLNSQTWDYKEYLNNVDMLVVDEAQHIGANILRKIAKEIPATYRLGMSGTLWREDGADLEIIACTGPKIAEIPYSYLIEHGYLVPADITIYKFPRKIYPIYARYSDIYTDYVVKNEFRNKYLTKVANDLIKAGRKVLIFVNRIEHGETLANMGGQHFLYANHPDRRFLIDAFKNGQIQCLISTSVLNEGFDLPPVDALILAAPQKSSIVTLQKIGRALRPYPNKKDAIVIDCADNVKYLWQGYQKRLELYKKEKAWKINKIIDVSTEEKKDGWMVY